MKEEYRDLLFKDLCARLPYDVICDIWFEALKDRKITEPLGVGGLARFSTRHYNVMPYLRPMSSMTNDEISEFYKIKGRLLSSGDFDKIRKESLSIVSNISSYYRNIDWLNAHHFDYRGLIEMGLAKVAPKGMYKQL